MNQALRPISAINISSIALLALMMLATARGCGGGGGGNDTSTRQQRIDDMYSRVRIEEAMEQWRKAPKE